MTTTPALPSTPSTLANRLLSTPDGWPLLRFSVGHILVDHYASFMLPILPMIAAHQHLSLGQVGVLSLVTSFTSSILQPFFGLWSERQPGLQAMALGLFLSAVGISAIGWAPEYWTLMVALGLGYAGVGFFHPAGTAYAHQLRFVSSTFSISTFMGAGTVGFAMGPLVSATLVERFGLPGTLWGMIPGLLITPLLLHRTRYHSPGHNSPSSELLDSSKALPPLGAPTIGATRPVDPPSTTAHPRWQVAHLTLINVCRAIVLIALPTFLPFLWRDQGYSTLAIGGIIALSHLLGGGLSMAVGLISKPGREKPLLLLSFIPSLLLIPMLPWLPPLGSIIAYVALSAVLVSTMALNVVLALKADRENSQLISGIVSGLSFGLAGLFMPWIGAIAQDHTPAMALTTLGIPMALGLVLIAILPKANP